MGSLARSGSMPAAVLSQGGVVTNRPALVYLLDDDRRVAGALASLLEAHDLETECHDSVEAFLAAHDAGRHGCLVLDLCMPGMSGLELQDLLRGKGVSRPIVFVTGQGDIPSSVRAMRAGAITFLPKPVAGAQLLSAVREALDVDATERERRRGQQDLAIRLSSLTPRERQVMELVVAGRLNKQIAAELGTAEKTVKVHRSSLMRKLRVRTPAALAGLVTRSGGPALT